MIFYDIYSLFGPADNINKRKETVKHPNERLITILQNDSIIVKVVQLV